jgi:Na+/proline symporter
MSIVWIVLFSLAFIILIFAAISINVSSDNDNQQPILDKKTHEMLVNRLREGMVVGIIMRSILAMAWLKTFQYIDLEINKDLEIVFVAILYILTFFVLISVAYKTAKKHKINKESMKE